MNRPTRIALKSAAGLLIVIGVAGALGAFPWREEPRAIPVPPEPPASSIPLSPTGPPGDRLGEGAITMQQVIRDGGEVGWLLIAALGVGLVLIVVFADRRPPSDRAPPP